MGKVLAFSALYLIAAGCTSSSGVMDTGGGTYAVTASAGGLAGGSDKAANDQAKDRLPSNITTDLCFC